MDISSAGQPAIQSVWKHSELMALLLSFNMEIYVSWILYILKISGKAFVNYYKILVAVTLICQNIK
jgi:hypothetical protein